MGQIQQFIDKAVEYNMPALAITDHGESAGAFELYELCKKSSIKPILGTEFYIRTELGVGHLIALAKNDDGWKNILAMQEHGFSLKPFT